MKKVMFSINILNLSRKIPSTKFSQIFCLYFQKLILLFDNFEVLFLWVTVMNSAVNFLIHNQFEDDLFYVIFAEIQSSSDMLEGDCLVGFEDLD